MLAQQTIRQEPTPGSAVGPAWFTVAAAGDPANDGASASAERRVAALYNRAPGPAAAEDATQETFVRVLRHADHLPPEAEALPWLSRIATNYCLNELRHLRIAAAVAADDEPLRPGPSSPEDEAADRQIVRKVLAPI